jgi:heme exporter protein B
VSALFATVGRDLRLHFRRPADVLNPLAFFLIVISLFPLGIGPAPETLAGIAAGVIWVAALLSLLLSIDTMFRSDYEDGTLEQMILGRQPLLLLVLGKLIAQWLVSGLPIAVLSPLFGMMFFLSSDGIKAIVLALLLGTPTLVLLGAIGGALTLGLRQAGLVLSIIVLPLYVPVLILGTAMVDSAVSGLGYTGHMLWLGALLLFCLALAPVATQFSLKIAISH